MTLAQLYSELERRLRAGVVLESDYVAQEPGVGLSHEEVIYTLRRLGQVGLCQISKRGLDDSRPENAIMAAPTRKAVGR